MKPMPHRMASGHRMQTSQEQVDITKELGANPITRSGDILVRLGKRR